MGQFIQREIFRRSEIGPMQAAGQQILAAVAYQVEEGVVGFGNPVKFSSHDASDGGFRRESPVTRARPPQFLIPLVALAKVTYDSCKTLQTAVFVFEGHG